METISAEEAVFQALKASDTECANWSDAELRRLTGIVLASIAGRYVPGPQDELLATMSRGTTTLRMPGGPSRP